MATALSQDALILGRNVSNFAQKNIAPLSTLHRENRFPMDIWQAMGREGFLGLSISKAYGGKGRSALDVSIAAHSLVKEGHNLGMALSFLIHQIIAHHVVETWASENQKKRYLPNLASGKITACLAVSEPKIGAHPKHITSTVVKTQEGYTLNGEKSYLTNGPIADLFVFIAVSNSDSVLKRFSAFMVPRNTPGLEVLAPMDIPFFKPAPHGSIRLSNCKVPAEALLGPEDSAYEDIVLPVRAVEDALMMGAVTGALEKQAICLAEALQKKGQLSDEFLKIDLGKLKSMLDTAKILSYESASMVDSGVFHPDQNSLNLYFRHLARDYHIQLEIILKNARIDKTGLLEAITNDLAASARIGGQLAKIRQMRLGAAFFLNGEKD
ncbi:MAG: acyl-CoA/acyl-ACP dehydrogenase [Proteobacteria bacterium]|nr:acyl-CoA/acyl-ACP dehydrogenase [Pseudomonadota bacterium]